MQQEPSLGTWLLLYFYLYRDNQFRVMSIIIFTMVHKEFITLFPVLSRIHSEISLHIATEICRRREIKHI